MSFLRRSGVVLLLTTIGCKNLTGADAALPAGTNDPGTYNTPSGALATYNQAVSQFQEEFQDFILVSGMLTDEFRSRQGISGGTIHPDNVPQDVLTDSRNMSTALALRLTTGSYTDLQYGHLNDLRNQIAQAKGALNKYTPSTSPALRGQLYALEGYVEIMLADLFCGDIPLSTLDFEKDYTLSPGLRTAEVYHHASAQFDTAISLATDSVSVQMLARIGKARALVAMDSFPQAAAAVSAIPDGFIYPAIITWGDDQGSTNRRYSRVEQADTEGVNGLPYLSSGDPRTVGASVPGGTFPAKYPLGTYDTVHVADWIEARLIQAEADLASGGTQWITILNTMRTDGTFSTSGTDTTWGLGTAAVFGQTQGVRPLVAPATRAASVDSLFADRAFWLFATGHRQGDLRRFMRAPYSRRSDQAFPTGGPLRTYPGFYHYGPDVNAPIPATEATNPKFNPAECVTNVP